ncbi:hypothetical protein [Undibacterium sp. SXout20W]|uniref:hypothetical protein n=1 Tax=Undibacterium sp. SXout20W TaxID=3413051 RepID=UPI003BF12CDC
MSIRSRSKRAARQHKHTNKWQVNPTGGLGILQKCHFEKNIAPQKLDGDQRFEISKAGWASLTVVVSDSIANADHWADLATAANLALMLAEQGYGPEHESVFIRAQEALTRMYLRGTQKNIWRFDGQGLQDMRDTLELHDLQCEHATNGDIQNALTTIRDRILTGNVFEFQLAEAA